MQNQKYQREFDVFLASLHQLEATANNFGIRFINDESARIKYNKLTKKMSNELLYEVRSGKLTPLQGAEKAQSARNIIMEQIRKITSDIGLAKAQKRKQKGKGLPELQEKYAKVIFRKSFNELSESQKSRVWVRIVRKSGAPDNSTNLKVRAWGIASKGFIAITMATATYNIATADDKVTAVVHEGVVLGGGYLGGVGGGAAAGLICGPGAPLCVGIGVFLGGIMGALGGDELLHFFSIKPASDEDYDGSHHYGV